MSKEQGTCSECEYSREPPCSTCKNCFVQQRDVFGSNFKRTCPLPRIGSKKWGWAVTDAGKWESPLASQYVIWGHSGYSNAYYVQFWAYSGYCVIAKYIGLDDAKTVVESRVRRDWRRENRGKK